MRLGLVLVAAVTNLRGGVMRPAATGKEAARGVRRAGDAAVSGGNDPAPWVHVGGTRVSDPRAPESPQGGYTYRPRHGYADHAERFQSRRWPFDGYCADCDPA